MIHYEKNAVGPKHGKADLSEDIFMNPEHRITIEALATILGGSFLINLAILLLWFCMILFCSYQNGIIG
ncbi:MAG TPA: hypothetical protein VMT12_02955 [Syntrophales bacterium]|nr:hypothetical protein [Syntrophales bacterium]